MAVGLRIAIVSPYSWTYHGGVNNHVEALAEELIRQGDDVRVLAPCDPPGRLSRIVHGRPAQHRELAAYVIPLGRTAGFPANGAQSNLAVSPTNIWRMRRALRRERFDVIHVQEPIAPLLGWFFPWREEVPVVGTFHAYSTKPLPNYIANALGARLMLNRLTKRIAVSAAAEWTGRRWFGGRYERVPNAVHLDRAPGGPKPPSDRFEILFLGRSEPRKGLPVALAAVTALVDHVPTRLTVVGVEPEELAEFGLDDSVAGCVESAGSVSRDELWRRIHDADVLCAPSLGGESFGLVLVEAFAAGTPVVASAIAGYSDVVDDGVNGVLVPPGDARALGEALRDLALDRPRLRELSAGALASARQYDWPAIASQIRDVYEQAIAVPPAPDRLTRWGRRLGIVPSDGGPPAPSRRLASLDPVPAIAQNRRRKTLRRVGIGLTWTAAAAAAVIGIRRIGVGTVTHDLVGSSPQWLVLSLILMATAMTSRAFSWHAIARSALSERRVGLRDVMSGTFIGVLMSTAFPGRVGEPARALVVARRVGRLRQTFPTLLGTLVSQTVLNIIALIILGVVVVVTTPALRRHEAVLPALAVAPLLIVGAILLMPRVLPHRGESRLARFLGSLRRALLHARSGLEVFRHPRAATPATVFQLLAWLLQVLSAYAVIRGLGLGLHDPLAAAAAALFAVNVTAIVPITPSNIGVFQAAIVAVLTTGYGVSAPSALAMGIVLQAIEIVTATVMGVPALLREGLTWSGLRLQAFDAVELEALPAEDERRFEARRPDDRHGNGRPGDQDRRGGGERRSRPDPARGSA